MELALVKKKIEHRFRMKSVLLEVSAMVSMGETESALKYLKNRIRRQMHLLFMR